MHTHADRPTEALPVDDYWSAIADDETASLPRDWRDTVARAMGVDQYDCRY